MIKVTVGEQKTQSKKTFPKLMINKEKDRIVFMYEPEYGSLIYEKRKQLGIGYYSPVWIMDDFTDFNEPITIQNL